MQKKIMIMTVVSHALMISIFSMFVRSELLAKLLFADDTNLRDFCHS